MAWHVMNRYTGILRPFVRAMALVYFGVGAVGVLLTGTRAAILAGAVALSIVPLTLPIRSMRSFLVSTALLVAVAGAAAVVVPDRTWARIFTIREEVLEGGPMTGRRGIWEAGLAVFPSRPLLGAGTGAYGEAVEPVMNTNRVGAHNLLVGILVEQGIVGFLIYAAMLGACAMSIMRMPPLERKLFSVLMLCWLIGALSNNWEFKKGTWTLLGLVAAQSAAGRVGSRLSPGQRLTGAASRRSVPAVLSPSVGQRAVR
jgi:O-antigen ligase